MKRAGSVSDRRCSTLSREIWSSFSQPVINASNGSKMLGPFARVFVRSPTRGSPLAVLPGRLQVRSEALKINGQWLCDSRIQATTTDPANASSPISDSSSLKPGDIFILDNIASHKTKSIRAVGATRFLPKYSPDLNPIEQAFAMIMRGCANYFFKRRPPFRQNVKRLI